MVTLEIFGKSLLIIATEMYAVRTFIPSSVLDVTIYSHLTYSDSSLPQIPFRKEPG